MAPVYKFGVCMLLMEKRLKKDVLMRANEVGRVAAILGSALTFFVGIISVVLGVASSTTEQSGNTLIVRGVIVVGLSFIAGYGASLTTGRPGRAALVLIAVAVLGGAVVFRSFLPAAAVLLFAAVLILAGRNE